MSQPLDGLRVLDFTWMAMGPYCTRVLHQMGAEVIKVETSARPDMSRRAHHAYGRLDVPPFDQLMAGKKSIQLNLKDDRARDLIYRLTAASDVVVENFRPGVAKRLGIDFETLRQHNDVLIMASLSAYGQFGSESSLPGYAAIFAAEGGLGHLTGYADSAPSEIRNPMDHVSGLVGAFALLSAIYRNKQQEAAVYIDLAATNVAAMLIGHALLAFQQDWTVESRTGNRHPGMVPHDVYRCGGNDRWVAIAVRSDSEFQSFCRAIGRPELGEMPRFATLKSRVAHRHELDNVISEWTALQDPELVVRALQDHGIPSTVSYSSQDLFHDEHLRSRAMFQDIGERNGVNRHSVRSPWAFTSCSTSEESWSPEMGEHNEYVYQAILGLTVTEYEQLVHDGVIS